MYEINSFVSVSDVKNLDKGPEDLVVSLCMRGALLKARCWCLQLMLQLPSSLWYHGVLTLT